MAESDLDYALVTGRFALAVADSDDPGDNPDVIYCNQGTVEFTPLITFEKVAEGTPWPFEAGHSVFVAEISDDDYVDPTVVGVDRTGARDGAGHLTWRGKPFIKLIDLTSSKINPNISDPAKATHSVAFKNVKAVIDGTPVNVNFPARPGRFTKDGPDGDGKNDLIRVLPVVTGSSTPITVGPRGISIVSAAVSPEGELLFTFSDDTEQSAGELPGTADAIEAATTATAAADTATTKAGEASTAATDATTAKDDAEVAKADAETAKVDAQTAKSDAEAARADLLGQKAQPSGIAPLDGSSKVPTTHLPTATATGVGAVELATNTEATTGTDTQRAVTPAGVKAVVDTIRDLSDATFANNLSASIADQTEALVPNLVSQTIATDPTVANNAASYAAAGVGVLTAGTTPALLTNRVPDPQQKTSGGTVSATPYPLTRITTGLPTGVSYGLETNRTGTLTSTIGSVFFGSTSQTDPLRWVVTPGETISADALIFTDQAGAKARLNLIFRDSSGATVGTTNTGAYANIAQNTYESRPRLGIVVPAGAAYVYAVTDVVTIDGSNTVTGAKVRATAARLFSGSTLPATYADGTFTSAGWAWVGTAHASMSKKVFVTAAEYAAGTYSEAPQAGSAVSTRVLKEWAAADAWQITGSIVRDAATDFITSAAVVWPDGSTGVYTATINTTYVAIETWSITHVASAKTVSQAAPTRGSDGYPTSIPALTVA